jgi:hypothetical protein
MLPRKTGKNEIEGMNIADFIGIEPIKLISQYQIEE